MKSALLLILCALSWQVQCAGITEVEERSYSTTTLHLPERCREEKFSELCRLFGSYLISRFEREMVTRQSELMRQDEGLDFLPKETALQEAFIDIKVLEQLGFSMVEADIRQQVGETKRSFVETFNIENSSGNFLSFDALFDKPELAAMLCARRIEEEYAGSKAELLPLVVTATEISPRNFLLRPDGLEFVFRPGTVREGRQVPRLLVNLKTLAAAGPKTEYFPALGKEPAKQSSQEIRAPDARTSVAQLQPPRPDTQEQGEDDDDR